MQQQQKDTDLVCASRDGDKQAFAALVERYRETIFFLVRRIVGNDEEAGETTQDVFIKVYRHLDRFDGRASFSTWLYRIACNTALSAVRRHVRQPLPISERMLASLPDEAVDALFAEIAAGRIRTEPRSMLRIAGDLPAGETQPLALNEFAVQRSGAGMISVETYVDGQMVATYHGDGVLLSTPPGSTAYSLSAGGPVVAPACACLIISPLAPHNLTMRPVVVPDSARISLRLLSPAERAFCSVDNRTEQLAEGAEIEIAAAERRIFLAVAHNISFYDTLRNKMMWGVDVRS